MTQPTSGNAETVVNEARTLLSQGQSVEAARRLRLHLSRHPGSATEQMLLGVALSQSGEGLAALQAFEQAVALEPANAVFHYNLGQAYQEFGRLREALAEMERALQLRPDYPTAARAAGALRERLAPSPTSEAPMSAAPGLAVPASAAATPWLAADTEPVDERPVAVRLLAAAWQLLIAPGQAINGGLDGFFNTPGAVGAVINFFLLSVSVTILVSLSSLTGRAGSIAVIVGLAGVINVAATAATIATFNRMTGGIGDFAADFGSLALSFAMIQATLSLLAAPLIPLAGMFDAGTGLAVIIGLWTYALEVALVMAATDINLITAMALLAGANFVARVATGVVFGALFAGMMAGPR